MKRPGFQAITAALLLSLGLLLCAAGTAWPLTGPTPPPVPSSGSREEGASEAQAQSFQNSSVIDAIANSYSARNFIRGTVSDEDLKVILEAGAKAPSARNMQPWKFTVITNAEINRQIVQNAPEGSVVIVVSGLAQEMEGVNPDFDCALATQNMYMAAQSLGLGAHIYTGPVRNINEGLKDRINIPDGYDAVSVLLIGQVEDAADGIASATPRNPLDNTVNYVE